MIILDTSILRSFGPESSSADLLHAIKAVCGQRIGMPWMVCEELAAQQAIKYEELHERAVQAVEALRQGTPWPTAWRIPGRETERVRDHWRKRWAPLIDVIPTSDEAVRTGLFREANRLAPCRESKGQKTGARDAAIWLSAVEYAKAHPDESVYFVSANTKDFGDGSSYPYPMGDDIAGMRDRFFLMTDLDQVAARFTETVETDVASVAEALDSASVQVDVIDQSRMRFPTLFEATFRLTDDRFLTEDAVSWWPLEAELGAVEDARAYRIGDQEWCTASVMWHIGGVMRSAYVGGVIGVVTWPTTVLFSFGDSPNLTVLRDAPPRPASPDVLNDMGVPGPDVTVTEAAITELRRERAMAAHSKIHDSWASVGRLPRIYGGAFEAQDARRRMARQAGEGETSAPAE
ncbi:PIN domain-containing protein [Streptomyces werraensis]|uniref:PIN domain-containing protein n=1 Tax=Streptomyces werraensis TaxID=68284 RepID=UPI0036FA93D7